MKKVLALALSVLLVPAVFAGCGGSAPPVAAPATPAVPEESATEEVVPIAPEEAASAEPVTIRFWKAAVDEARNAWWAETLTRFEAKHSDIKVEFLGVPGDPATFDQRLDMSIAGNDAPDIISTYLSTTYISRELLEPLEDYYDSWANKDKIPKKYLAPVYAMDYSNADPHLFVTPEAGNVECFYIRPDLLSAQGFESINTWDDFFAVAEKATDGSQGIYSYIIRGGAGSATALGTQMYSYSGITDYFIDGKCTVNDPKNIEYAEKFFGGFGTYTSQEDVTKGWTEMAAQFQSGKAAMMIHNLGSVQANYDAFGNDTDKVLAAPYPASITGKRVLPSSNPSGNMIMASSEHKDESWMLLEWLMEADENGAYHELMAKIPPNSDALSQSWIQDVSFMKMGADMMNDSNTEFCVIPYYLPNYNTILSTYVEPGIQSVLLGQTTAEELLNGWAEQLQTDYDTLMG